MQWMFKIPERHSMLWPEDMPAPCTRRPCLPAHSAWGLSLHPGLCDAEALASCPLDVARGKYRRAGPRAPISTCSFPPAPETLFTSGGSGGGGGKGGGGFSRRPMETFWIDMFLDGCCLGLCSGMCIICVAIYIVSPCDCTVLRFCHNI